MTTSLNRVQFTVHLGKLLLCSLLLINMKTIMKQEEFSENPVNFRVSLTLNTVLGLADVSVNYIQVYCGGAFRSVSDNHVPAVAHPLSHHKYLV